MSRTAAARARAFFARRAKRRNTPPVLPDVSSPCCKNISISEYRKMWFTPPTSPQHEGRSADRHDTWGGMRWTRRCAGDAYPMRTVKSCGRGPPTLGSTPGSRAPGGRRLTSPVLRREREVSRKPLRRECRSVSALPDYLCALLLFSTQGCGCGQRPAFPAPSYFEGATVRCITRTRHRAAGTRTLVVPDKRAPCGA